MLVSLSWVPRQHNCATGTALHIVIAAEYITINFVDNIRLNKIPNNKKNLNIIISKFLLKKIIAI
mgnify:CR=1 FL=1